MLCCSADLKQKSLATALMADIVHIHLVTQLLDVLNWLKA